MSPTLHTILETVYNLVALFVACRVPVRDAVDVSGEDRAAVR